MHSLLQPRRILNGGNGAGLRDAGEGVGVEAVLDAGQSFNQLRVRQGEADTQPGKSPTFGQSLHDDEVGMIADEARGALRPEIDIGLINQHHTIPPCTDKTLNLPAGEGKAGIGIRIGDDNPASGLLKIVIDVNCEIISQRDMLIGQVE